MAKRFLYLIRHGQYDSAANDHLGGSLNDLGRQQAACTAQALRHLPVSAIHCSSLRRAVQTADIIAAAFEGVLPQTTERLWECIPTIPPRLTHYFSGRNALNDEALADCKCKLDEFYEAHFKPARGEEKHELVVCHGNVIRYLVSRVMEAPPDTWATMLVHNCGISRIVIESERKRFVVSHNDFGHLPLELQTE